MIATIAHHARRIALEENCTTRELFGRSHEANPSRARHRLWAVVREETGMSYPKLGKLFRRTHDTVLRGVRSVTR
jgi:chromosomal replication initiation ATPase DnaA